MSIDPDLVSKLNQNQREIFIVETDDLLAAWIYKMKSSSRCTKDLTQVPTEYRFSHPKTDAKQLIPCHVSIEGSGLQNRLKVVPPSNYSTMGCHTQGRTINKNQAAAPPELAFCHPKMETVQPMTCHVTRPGATHQHPASAAQPSMNSTMHCHGLGRTKRINMDDLNSFDRVEAAEFSKQWLAPHVSPILDTVTMARVAKDLGIFGKAIPKIIKGRQYIAFSGYAGLRNFFTGTIYSLRNAKIINMGIGALGITKMATKGGIITIILTGTLSVLECYLKDETAWYQLAGNIGADILKVGIATLMGWLGGFIAGSLTGAAIAPIGALVLVSVFVGYGLQKLDDKYRLTAKLVSMLKDMDKNIKKSIEELDDPGFIGTLVSDS